MNSENKPYLSNPSVKKSMITTVVMFLSCLSVHILTLLGLAGAIAYLGEIEHALLLLSIGSLLFTIYVIIKHKKSGQCTHKN